jgi:HEPN domain-containing protein
MNEIDEARWAEVRRWLEIASEDLRVAHACLRLDEPAVGAAAFHCQQAAEKLMKGLLVAAGRSFRKTHDLDELANEAVAAFPALRAKLDVCRPFTQWGTILRYPEIGDEAFVGPTAAEVASALPVLEALAAAVTSLGAGKR